MKRNNRNKNNIGSNRTIYITGGALILAILTFIITFVIYSKKLDSDLYSLDSEYLSKYTNQNNINSTSDNTKTASSSIGKTIEESKNNVRNDNNVALKDTTNITNTASKSVSKTSESTDEKENDPVFKSPLDGQLSREYAKDSLVYSETLKEWITHLGVDIQAEKASVVKAAANGVVKHVKNDPRYGLTIIIEHSNKFQTLYANLLTTEFVSEGEKVKAGQTIGTVGDSSVYEIVDEPHLHFEILKNNENQNPSNYIDFK